MSLNQPGSACPQCNFPMCVLFVGKNQVDEQYCEQCDISIDREGIEHHGSKAYGNQESKWEEIKNG